MFIKFNYANFVYKTRSLLLSRFIKMYFSFFLYKLFITKFSRSGDILSNMFYFSKKNRFVTKIFKQYNNKLIHLRKAMSKSTVHRRAEYHVTNYSDQIKIVAMYLKVFYFKQIKSYQIFFFSNALKRKIFYFVRNAMYHYKRKRAYQ